MSATTAKLELLQRESVPKALLKCGLPTMAAMLLSAFYNVIDAFFVGRLGTSQIGAIAVALPLSEIIVSVGLLFGYQLVFGTFFLALGRGKEGGLLSIGRQGLFFIPVILVLPRLFGLDGVIFSQFAADCLSVLLVTLFVVRLVKRESRT